MKKIRLLSVLSVLILAASAAACTEKDVNNPDKTGGNPDISADVTSSGGNEEPEGFVSSYTEKAYSKIVKEYCDSNQKLECHNFDAFEAKNRLENPCPDGIARDFGQFVDYVDYNVFYGEREVTVKPDWDCGEYESLIDRLYWNSGLIASMASLKWTEAGDGFIRIFIKYYDSCSIVSRYTAVNPEVLLPPAKPSSRSADYSFPAVDAGNGITVYSSDQLCYALMKGHKVSAVPGSPAEKVLNKACDVLRSVCDDSMTPFEKMYAIYCWFMDNSGYDSAGEEWCGKCLDPEYETDMFCALLESSRAEGPLLYGQAICFGYAKAYCIMCRLEGLEANRVVGRESACEGRSGFIRISKNKYEPAISSHSYLYVTVDGKDYLSDVTFSFAGTVKVAGSDVKWSRYLSLAITKEEHAYIYDGLVDDYSRSDKYNPGSWDYLKNITYDGTHDLYCSDLGEVRDLFGYLQTRVNASSADFFSACIVVDSGVPFSAVQSTVTGCCKTLCEKYAMGGMAGERSYLILAFKKK